LILLGVDNFIATALWCFCSVGCFLFLLLNVPNDFSSWRTFLIAWFGSKMYSLMSLIVGSCDIILLLSWISCWAILSSVNSWSVFLFDFRCLRVSADS
jgi:hypothetical protein